jgi:hypothetical protein
MSHTRRVLGWPRRSSEWQFGGAALIRKSLSGSLLSGVRLLDFVHATARRRHSNSRFVHATIFCAPLPEWWRPLTFRSSAAYACSRLASSDARQHGRRSRRVDGGPQRGRPSRRSTADAAKKAAASPARNQIGGGPKEKTMTGPEAE